MFIFIPRFNRCPKCNKIPKAKFGEVEYKYHIQAYNEGFLLQQQKWIPPIEVTGYELAWYIKWCSFKVTEYEEEICIKKWKEEIKNYKQERKK